MCNKRHLNPGDLLISPLDQTGTDLAVVTHIDREIARCVSIFLFDDVEINLNKDKLKYSSFLRNREVFLTDVIILPLDKTQRFTKRRSRE